MAYLPYLETLLLTIGLVLVIYALVKYIRRTNNYHAVWQVFVNKLNDLKIEEFKLFRLGIVFLFVGILVQIVNLTLYGG
ncbi:hypothetical protein [Paraferrimonas haliotis]|uniref:Uncharacterized protein n=1 Tax=Paraferrimonas haliotis TaxID=2013866 RepID=A0AA37TQB9_9GAMM|nr:hypothetical protein [Paraferrimonas haliotis]GLS82681.1 hypothetical protein GCM10007894_06580 [Paraferrimonas haliotis]